MVPPFKPNISGEFGLDNFDAQFTNEPIQLTPDDECVTSSSCLQLLLKFHPYQFAPLLPLFFKIHYYFRFRDVVKKIDQSEFEGFEYINPLLMSAEECV